MPRPSGSGLARTARYSPSGRAAAASAKALLRFGAERTTRFRAPYDFVIIGAKRGGTTSLWRYLLEHPGVQNLVPAAANVKGTYYLADEWNRGERWWRSHPATRSTLARRARRLGYEPVVGEASPYYLHHPLAPERAARLLPPDAVFVAVLRDPTERAYSHYRERRANDTEPLSFDEAIEAEAWRLRGEEDRIVNNPGYRSFAHRHQGYLAQSRYASALRRWFDSVGQDRVLVLISEELYADPQAAVDEVTDRLGLPRRPLRNPTAHNSEPSREISQDTRERLTTALGPDVEATERLLGRRLPWQR